MRATIRAMKKAVISTAPIILKTFPTATGKFATIPEKIMREIPLPIPLSVICSPSHIKNEVPAANVITVISLKPQPPAGTIMAPPGPVMFSRPTAIPKP